MASALTATMIPPSATRNRLDRLASSSSPPGSWLNKPARLLALQDEADVLLSPFFISQKYCNKRTESGLHSREKEIDAVGYADSSFATARQFAVPQRRPKITTTPVRSDGLQANLKISGLAFSRAAAAGG